MNALACRISSHLVKLKKKFNWKLFIQLFQRLEKWQTFSLSLPNRWRTNAVSTAEWPWSRDIANRISMDCFHIVRIHLTHPPVWREIHEGMHRTRSMSSNHWMFPQTFVRNTVPDIFLLLPKSTWCYWDQLIAHAVLLRHYIRYDNGFAINSWLILNHSIFVYYFYHFRSFFSFDSIEEWHSMHIWQTGNGINQSEHIKGLFNTCTTIIRFILG